MNIQQSSSSVPSLKEFGFKRNMTEQYEVGKLIGAGTFGSVHEAIHRGSGKQFAVKSIAKRFSGDQLEEHFAKRVHHEVDIYTHMGNSLNVATLYDVYEDDSYVDLVMEYCSGGELWKRIRKQNYSEVDAARIVREILRTISQFHANGVVIRDIKPENFLFADDSPDAHLKAIDFGIATYCDEDGELHDRAGTPIYVAPEVLKMKYGLKADLWSAGVLAYQLLTGRLPFVGDNGLSVSRLYMTRQVFANKDVFRAILYADLDFESSPWNRLSGGARDLVQKLLTRDPSKRVSAQQALEHPWFRCLDDADADHCQQPTNDGLADDADIRDSIVQRLQRFGTYGRLKQIALRGIANVALTMAGNQEALRELERAFAELDVAHNGKVPYSAGIEYLKRGNFDLSPLEMEQLIAQMDITNDGYINYADWLAAMIEWRSLQESEEWEEWVSKAFNIFDEDGSGTIGVEELQRMLCTDGVCPMPDVVTCALRQADRNHDGCISLDEFVKLVQVSRLDSLSNFESRLRRRSRDSDSGSDSDSAALVSTARVDQENPVAKAG